MMRLAAWLNGAVFTAIGLAFALATQWMAGGLGIHFDGAAGIGDFRAVYGGMQVALALTILIMAARRSYRDAVMIGLLAVTGLATVRIAGMIFDGHVGPQQWLLLAPEVAGAALNGTLLVLV